MSDDSKLDNMAPLGKSVEEVEADTSNRVNPPAGSEADRADDEVSFVPVVNSNLSNNVPNVGGPVATTLNSTEGARRDRSPDADDDSENSRS